MKSSILVCQLDSGVLHSVASPTFAEAQDAFARVRKDRNIEVGKKVIPVFHAVLISQNSMSSQVIKAVNCNGEAIRERLEADAKKAKAKAEAQKAKAEETK